MNLIINTDNAAFDEGLDVEVSRILRELADQVEQGHRPESVRDINGNVVGTIDW